MRILHVMSHWGWSSDAYWAAQVVSELERDGHEAILCCRPTSSQVMERAREAGVRRIGTLRLASGFNPSADVPDLARLLTWLPQVDLIHVHRGKEHWLAALANRLCRTRRPLVRTRHIVQAVRPHAANRWLYRNATDLVTAATHVIRRQYVASGLLPAERVVTLAGGVDTTRFHPGVDGHEVRATLDIPSYEPLIGMVSGFRAMKGHAVVLEALARLAGEGIRPRILFAGQGTHETAIRGAVIAARLQEQCRFTGFTPDLPKVMAALTIGLYAPLESDGMSRVIFEYLAMGCPLIASRVGVVPEILTDGREALLVPAGDPGALAQAIRRLLEDPLLARRLGRAGRELAVEGYSASRVTGRLVSLYSGLLDART
ncbi:MAG: glycosyltransferase family 4 protein [Candidatus Methylomirabilia bacterium]